MTGVGIDDKELDTATFLAKLKASSALPKTAAQEFAETEARLMATSLQSWWGGGDVPIYELPPAIVTHGGPKTMGIGFFI